jgi:hypothetical protein
MEAFVRSLGETENQTDDLTRILGDFYSTVEKLNEDQPSLEDLENAGIEHENGTQ